MHAEAHRLAMILLVCCGSLGGAEEAVGQPSGALLDVTTGMGYGGGGEFVERRGITATTLLAFRAADSGWLGGLSTAIEGPLAEPDLCTPDGDGGCVPGFPLLLSVGVLVGGERAVSRRLSVGLLAGPSLFWGDEGGRQPGLRARLDIHPIRNGRVAPFGSVGGAVIRAGDGDRLWLGSLSVGLRVR